MLLYNELMVLPLDHPDELDIITVLINCIELSLLCILKLKTLENEKGIMTTYDWLGNTKIT